MHLLLVNVMNMHLLSECHEPASSLRRSGGLYEALYARRKNLDRRVVINDFDIRVA